MPTYLPTYRAAKDGLHQYRNMSQQHVSLSVFLSPTYIHTYLPTYIQGGDSLEKVINFYVDLAERKAGEARKYVCMYVCGTMMMMMMRIMLCICIDAYMADIFSPCCPYIYHLYHHTPTPIIIIIIIIIITGKRMLQPLLQLRPRLLTWKMMW